MEGDAGASQLASQLEISHLDAQEEPDASTASATVQQEGDALDTSPVEARRAERFGRVWVASIGALLLLLAGGVAVAGYLAVRANDDSAAAFRDETAAVAAARDCVTATQAPNFDVMSASQAKMIDCTTGDFGTQTTVYSGILADAYQAAKVKLEVTDMRAAPERHNDDGTINVLVALRVKVTTTQAADQELGYRLRVLMAPADGTYKVAKLEQVTS